MAADAVMLRISVVIPTFNRAGLLPRALDSVLAQRLAAHEIIVVDDGSSDATATLLARRYVGVRYLRQPHRGVSAARNRGIRAASGDWIALLDSDDAWHPDKLQAQAQFTREEPSARLVHCDELWLRNGAPLRQRPYHRKRGGDIFLDCLPRCVISPSAALLHATLFSTYGMFDETLPACEDYDLWLRICAHEPVGFVDRALVIKHGGHADQLSRTVNALDRYRIQALARLLDGATLDAPRAAAVRAQLADKLAIFIAGARKRAHLDDVHTYEALRCRLLPA